ncbi:MAG: hypothetical protein MZV49_02975 [Rhodopseudomonas palustris]|nr:hypothetical protein [Rhodopseudomonas palustris]
MPLIVDNTLATPYLIRPDRPRRRHRRPLARRSSSAATAISLGGIIVDAGTFDWSRDNQLSDAESSRAWNITA